jgi:hypothetical protein
MQVPDDILALLNDTTIFGSSNSELTTKEILKRFQDRKGQMPVVEISEVYNRADNSTRPPPRRVETDPAVWQEETTVRPVQDVPMPPYMVSGASTPSGPPGARGQEDMGHLGQPSTPWKNQHFNRSDGHVDSPTHGTRKEWRNSGCGRQGNGLGVGGNS